MKKFQQLAKKIVDKGISRPDRTGTGTIAIFGTSLRFDLSRGFPAITTKKLAWRAMVSELLWFIEGSGDERRLREILHGDRDSTKPTIWTDNAEAGYWKDKAKFPGDLGRVYGTQWRQWRTPLDNSTWVKRLKNLFKKEQYKTTDQLTTLIDGIKNDPYGRRHILTAWNPGELQDMALPPCHMFAQFFVSPLSQTEINTAYNKARRKLTTGERKVFDLDATGVSRKGRVKTLEDLVEIGLPTRKLSCQMYQRSVDTFLGLPFNIASYSLFTHMIAQVCGLGVGEFIWVGGDTHVYDNHIDQVAELLNREPFHPPTLVLNPEIMNITQFTMDDISLNDYQSHGSIKATMAV